MNIDVLYIRDLLPDQKDSIDGLSAENKEFMCLCDDFDACVYALKYWAASEKPESRARVDEYRELTVTLHKEIMNILDKYVNRGKHGGGIQDNEILRSKHE